MNKELHEQKKKVWFIIAPRIKGHTLFWFNKQEIYSLNIRGITSNLRQIESNLSDDIQFYGIINDTYKFVIYDYRSKNAPQSYRERLNKLSALGCLIDLLQLKNIKILDIYYVGDDTKQILQWRKFALEQGYDGIQIISEEGISE